MDEKKRWQRGETLQPCPSLSMLDEPIMAPVNLRDTTPLISGKSPGHPTAGKSCHVQFSQDPAR